MSRANPLVHFGLTVAFALPVIAQRPPAPHPFAVRAAREIPALQAKHRVPGVALALIRGGEVVHTAFFGTATAGKKVAITEDSGFNVASVTKSVTTFVVLKAVEDGLVGLDDPVFDHITRWKLPGSAEDPKGVTISRLLSHTAGLHGDGLSDWKPDDELPPIEKSLSGLAGARGVRLRWTPGKRFAYANGGYALLQLMLMEKTGGSFEAYARKKVLAPLGMSRSSYLLPPRIVKASVTPHHPHDRATWIVHRTVTSTGGLHTTLGDLCRFVQALCDRGPGRPRGAGVLKPETVERMFVAAPPTGGGWGLGVAIHRLAPGVTVVGHAGGAWGWISDYLIDPKRGHGYVLLANSTGSGPLHDRLKKLWKAWYVEHTRSD